MPLALKIYPRETVELTIESRTERGKGPVGRLRREQSMLPGVVYGHKQDPVAFKIGARALERTLSSGGRNAIFLLSEAGNGNTERAVVREIQYHKVRGDIMHVDFLRIDPDEELTAAVPLHTTGTPVGVRVGGGAALHSLTTIDMTCVASELPAYIEIDVTDLDIGDSIHVRDLLEQESRIVSDPAGTVVSVLAPRLTIDDELEAEAEAEGVEVEEGAEEAGDAAEEGGADADADAGGDVEA